MNYRMHGHYEFTGKMGTNTLISGLKGPNTLEFKDGGVIRFNTPDWKLGGTVMGERSIEGCGSIVFEDFKNGLKAVVVLGTYKESGWISKSASGSKSHFTGTLYRMNMKKAVPTQFGKD